MNVGYGKLSVFVVGVVIGVMAMSVVVGLSTGEGSLAAQDGAKDANKAEQKPEAPSYGFHRPPSSPPADDGKLRIIAFGAHPDDCELKAAGVGAKWAALGHKVKFVSVTNGDIGHWGMAGGPLAQRRTSEVEEAAKILGIEAEVLDIHDGELLPTLENRKWITKLIREWGADVVLSHRPNDYHPDHRNVGLLVQDAAFMVTVPYFCPDVPYLERNPAFFFYEDRFQRPNPFRPDVVVSIDDVIEKKLATTAVLRSQFFEGGALGGPHLLPDPSNAAAVAAREKSVREGFDRRFASTASRFGLQLSEWYGADKAKDFRYAEAFEVCEYGRQPNKAELKKLFPFFE